MPPMNQHEMRVGQIAPRDIPAAPGYRTADVYHLDGRVMIPAETVVVEIEPNPAIMPGQSIMLIRHDGKWYPIAEGC